MPEKKNGDFLKMAWGAMSDLGSKAGKAIQSAVEQATPKKGAPEAGAEAQPGEEQVQPSLAPDEAEPNAKPASAPEAEAAREPDIPAEAKQSDGSEPAPEQGSPAKPDRSEAKEPARPAEVEAIPTQNALKIIYYLMAADGEIFQSEEERFDAIGRELDPGFAEHKAEIMRECQAKLDQAVEPEDYFDVLLEGVCDAIRTAKPTQDTFITPKLLLWNLLTVAQSDESYSGAERRLLKSVARRLNIDRSILPEMESCAFALMDLERETAWIKTTNRPYLVIEAMVNELADRKNVIMESAKALISL